MERMSLTIEGMSCGHCVGAVERALRSVAGVQVERVGVGSAEVCFDPAVVGPDRIQGAVAGQGYGVLDTGRQS